jgi:hypothetical protein
MPALERELDIDKIKRICAVLNQKAALVGMLRKENGDVEESMAEIKKYLDFLKTEVETPFLIELSKKKIDRLLNLVRESFETLSKCSKEGINSSVGFVWERLKEFESLPPSNSGFVRIFISDSVLPMILDGVAELNDHALENEPLAKEALSIITFLTLLLKKLLISLKKNDVNDNDLDKIVILSSGLSEIVDDYIIELDSLDENLVGKKAVIERCSDLINLIPEESEVMNLCVKKLSTLGFQ